jgi:integrase
MKSKIMKRTVDVLLPGQSIADTEIRGFVARRLPSGAITYGFRFRNPEGRQRWLPLGLHGAITPDEARGLAKKRAGEVADDRDPVAEREAARAAESNTLDAVLDTYIERELVGKRSAAHVERTFDRLVRPRLGTRSIYTVTRRDVAEMLDVIAAEHGAVMSDRVLAYLRRALNWWAMRDEKFAPPFVKGMARTKARDRARTRILDDQEIRDLWAALDELGSEAPACFPAFVRAALMTGQRRGEIAGMTAAEVDRAGAALWTIPPERYKTGIEHTVPLSAAVLRILPDRKSGFVFSSDGGKREFSGFSKSMRALAARIAERRKPEGRKPMPHWTLHDLRRTARSLMSRAAVSSDIAERVLGHVIGGVRGVYDRHRYDVEKRDALERLAVLVEGITTSPRGSGEWLQD